MRETGGKGTLAEGWLRPRLNHVRGLAFGDGRPSGPGTGASALRAAGKARPGSSRLLSVPCETRRMTRARLHRAKRNQSLKILEISQLLCIAKNGKTWLEGNTKGVAERQIKRVDEEIKTDWGLLECSLANERQRDF